MKKYKVEKQEYRGAFVESLGVMTIDEIRLLANKYIGDVFKDEQEVNGSIEYIEERGEELWLTDEVIDDKDIQICIEEVER